MKFPERPTCHDGDWRTQEPFRFGPASWRPPHAPEDKDRDWDHALFKMRTCSFCGSVHPEDLLRFLEEEGHTLGGADWKYGWPHKFYLEGGPSGKWYNDHLLDEGFDDEARARLLDALDKHALIRFVLEEGRLGYRAPYEGYQR